MTKQRRSFFVDDILHMVMPRKENLSNDGKRKRSISSEDAHPHDEEISTKKPRIQDLNHNDEESDYSRVVDVLGRGEEDEEEDNESSISDNSNNNDPHNGKLISNNLKKTFCVN